MPFGIQINSIKPIKALPGYEARVGFTGGKIWSFLLQTGVDDFGAVENRTYCDWENLL